MLLASLEGKVGATSTNDDGTTAPAIISVKHLSRTFCTFFPRYAALPFPQSMRLQIREYIESPELRTEVSVPTAMRPKNTADVHDLEKIVKQFYTSPGFSTNRARIQQAYACILSAISSEQIGSVSPKMM
jgi:hypothetical protein